MRSATRFSRACPTCGRNLEIPVEQIGRWVMCSHCHAEFRATLGSEGVASSIEDSLERRIDRLLAGSNAAPPKPHFEHPTTLHSRSYEV